MHYSCVSFLGFNCGAKKKGCSSSYKGKRLIGADSQFRGLVHYRHDGKPHSMQADMVLEKELS